MRVRTHGVQFGVMRETTHGLGPGVGNPTSARDTPCVAGLPYSGGLDWPCEPQEKGEPMTINPYWRPSRLMARLSRIRRAATLAAAFLAIPPLALAADCTCSSLCDTAHGARWRGGAACT